MLELVASARQRKFGHDKREKLPRYCRECDVRFACHGGCPKDRFIETPDGDPGLNYLCAGFKDFFHHVDGPMRLMAEQLQRGLAPSAIVGQYAAADPVADATISARAVPGANGSNATVAALDDSLGFRVCE